MGVFHGDNLDTAVAQELFEDINDHYLISENALIMLDRQPGDRELINELFRSVHTIKGDLGVVGFSPAMPLMTAVEEVLGIMRSGSLGYSPVISDLLLLVLDRVRALVDCFRAKGYVEYDQARMDFLGRQIVALTQVDASRLETLAAAVIRQLDPSVVTGADPIALHTDAATATGESAALDGDPDLAFFCQLITPVESRSRFWRGRSDRILKLALVLNRVGANPVDEKQLAVAVYVHDFGMACMPLELLHKETVLSDAEIQLLRSHVLGSAQLLQHMPQWAPAREIVLQHHEAADGSGYPYGLREREIADGAKMLAIADTFDAMTHSRAYATHQKRPIIRAVKEVNDLAGRQLSARWVEVFNQAVQPVLLAHRAKHF